MGLMLSILVVCVGVIEALSCFEHFQYGVIHCATNVYETARRRSSVFLKYTSRRLKLLSENSISEYDEQPEINVFEPIKIGRDERRTQLSEEECSHSDTIRKPKAIRISARPAKKLEKEDKIQIVKTLLERPRRPPTVRSISMPELVRTEEDIELSKIINDLAIEPIEEINIEIEEGNCEVLSRKFDELFDDNQDERRESSLDDLDENVTDDLEHFAETKFAQSEAICNYDIKSISEETENDEENLKSGELSPAEVEIDQQSVISDDKSVKDEDDLLKMSLEKEKPVTRVIKTNISQRVSDKGVDYFKEALSKFSQKTGNRFDRSISVDFNKVPSMRINKPAANFPEMSNDSMKLISEESISHNKLEDIILESDTPPGEVIDKTFEEIYENICDESLDAENTFEEIEMNIMGDAVTVESQGSSSPIPYEPEDQFVFLEDISQEGETSLSNGKTVPTAVYLKAVEQLAQLLVRESLNFHKIKSLIFENLNNLNDNEKLRSADRPDTHSRSQPENKRESHHVECRIPSESVQEMPDVKDLIRAEEKNVLNDGLKEGKTILVKMYDLTDDRIPLTEEFEKLDRSVVEGGISNFSVTDLEVANVGTGKPGEVVGFLKSEGVSEISDFSKDSLGKEHRTTLPELGGAITDVENRTEPSHKCDQRIQEVVEKDGQSNKSLDNANEEVRDKINSVLSKNEKTVEFMEKVEPRMEEREFSEIMEAEPAPSLLEFPTQSDFSRSEMEKKMTKETHTGFPQTGVTTVVESKTEPHVEDNQSLRTQDEIKIVNESNKAIDVSHTEPKVIDEPPVVEVNKLKENEEINTTGEICMQPDIAQPHLGVGENNQTVMPIHEPLLSIEFSKEINSEPNKIETELMVEQNKNKADTLEKFLAIDQKNKEVVEPIEEVQEEKPLPGQTEKPKDNLKSEISVTPDTTSPGDSNMAIEIVESKLEPLRAVEYTAVVQSEQDKKQTEVLAETGNIIKIEEFPHVDKKNKFLTDKEVVIDSIDKLEQEKPLVVKTEAPINNTNSEITIRHDATPHGDSSSLSENIQVGQPEREALELMKESNTEDTTVGNTDKSKKGDGIVPQESLKPAQTEQPILKFHDKDGEFVENVEFQPVDNTEGKNADKSRSDTTNISESTKTSIESKMESPCQDNQNERTPEGIEVKEQSNKTVDEFNTEVVNEKSTLLSNEKEAIDVMGKLKEEKPNEVEILQESVKLDTSLGNSDLGESTRVLKYQDTGENKKEKNLDQEENIKMEEMRSGDIVKQSGEPALKFHNKPGETEDKVEFEQVGIVEGNDVDKLHINSKKEAEPAGLGSAGREEEHSSDSKNSNAHETSEATSSAPEAFWLIFSGEYTKAMSKDWHSGHFSCWQCDEALTGQRYVLRDDHPYCIKCYESVFANVCEECNKIIGIDSKDLSYKDKHWHEACFLCNKCRVSLVDKQFGSKADKIYCGNCYDAQFASRCDGCGEIFRAGTKKMEYKTRQWHEKCFCCCVCKTPIGTKSFIPREQEIYCATCYEEKFATRCVKCNKIITSGGVTYKNEPWHRECFTCTNCNTSLAGQRFTSRDEKPYCADCFGELFAKRCTACSRPITGIGGTRFISFEDRHWHNDCFICASCKTSLVGRGFITDGDDIICPECAKQKLM